MPIDLAGYTKQIRDALKKGEYACVYVVSVAVPALCRVGYAEDLIAAVARLQRSSPTPIETESALWVPNRSIATNIAKAVQCDLVGSRQPSGWLNTAAATAAQAIELAAYRIHPGATMIWHDQLISQWRPASVRSKTLEGV